MSYLVLARKWRPKTFTEVVGQQHALAALINALDQNRLHHALLFSGTRGVGKTTLARILAKSINCEQGISSTPCGTCNACREVDSGQFVDLIEVDAASRTKVDDTRELLENIQYSPSKGRYKVYLIDEVHMLSISSFNALLKTLEEPPSHVKFLFATTDPQKLPSTILSRCLQFHLRRIDSDDITTQLSHILQQENIAFENEALAYIAKAADGSLRDALSLLDQAISQGAGEVKAQETQAMLGITAQSQLYQILDNLITGNAEAMIHLTGLIHSQGNDISAIFDDMLELLQRIATIQQVPNLEVSASEHTILQTYGNQMDPELVQLFYQIVLHGKRDLPLAANPRSGLEMTLLRMLQFQPAQVTDSVKSEVVRPKAAVNNEPLSLSEQEQSATTEQIGLSPAVKMPVSPTGEPINPSPAETSPTTSTVAETLSLTADNWLDTLSNLKLTALASQLAQNSGFISFNNNIVLLSITPELAHLANAKSQARLETALTEYLNQTIKIQFEQRNTQDTLTLAAANSEKAALADQQARESIHNDPTVQAIKLAFDARVIESTIKPID